MMLKQFKDFLNNTCKFEEASDTRIVAIDIQNSLIISIVANQRVLIAHKHQADMRFNGIVENVQQLKLILTLIKKGL